MANVDDKVVAMSFDSSKFESGIAKAISALDKLKEKLNFPNAGKGLNDVDAAAKNVNLSHIGKAIEDIKSKFSALSVVALSVLANIANKVVNAGLKLAKSLTIDPIISGFHEYETQLNAVQTILSNTAASGTKLKDVNKALNELNQYADKTIYNFSEMTKNIGTFTAAGVDLKTSTQSIKGIANLAALSGSNAQQASTAMYQLSQAISAGRVSLQDWNSVVNAGMGGTVFQRALAQTAEQMGTLDKGAVKLTGSMKNVSINGQSFRESVSSKPGEKSWLTSDVLTQTLAQLSGDLTDAQLKAKGYTEEQIKAIQTQAKMALGAATQVKTLSQLLDTTKEAVGSGWAQTWQIIFGDFGEAKTLFTGLSNAIGGFVSASSNARNKVLGDWKALGGRQVLLDGLKNAFEALKSVVTPIKDAFRDIFPPTTGRQLLDLTIKFRDFMAALKIGPGSADGLKRTFRGLFAILDIGKKVLGGILTVFGHVFSALSGGSGGVLQITGTMGDFFVAIDKGLTKTQALHKFFDGLGAAIEVPIRFVSLLTTALLSFFGVISKKSSGGISSSLGSMGKNLSPMAAAVDRLKESWESFLKLLHGSGDRVNPASLAMERLQGLWDRFGNTLTKIGDKLKPVAQKVGDAFSAIWDAVKGSFNAGSITALSAVFSSGILASIGLAIKKFLSGGLFEALKGGLLGHVSASIARAFDTLTGSLEAMQQNIKADTIKKIAVAVGILAASLIGLALVDPKKLASATAALTAAFGELLGAMYILTNITKLAGFTKLPIISAGLILLATALSIMSLAVRNLATLSWEQIAKGLGSIGVLLGGIAVAAAPLSKSTGGMIKASISIIAIAVAMKILASAIRSFGGLSWAEIGKGMISVAAALVIMATASKLFPPGLSKMGLSLIGIALAMKLLATAIAIFGGMDLMPMVKGIAGIAASLVVVGLAMQLMPPGMAAQAAGLVLVGIALKGVAAAIGSMGGMSVGAIAKGIITMSLALGILAIALNAMAGSLPGAAALAVAAASLMLLAPALKMLGGMSWGSIIKSMIALTGAIVIFAAASILLIEAVPAMIALGTAMVLLGAALALAGAGIFLIGAGFSAIAIAGPAAVAILLKALTGIVEAVPKAMLNFVKGILQVVQMLADTAPKFVGAVAQIIIMILNAVITAIPKIAQVFTELIHAGLKVIRDTIPDFVNTGFTVLTAFLTGINNNMPRLVAQVIQIIQTFILVLTQQMPNVVAGGGGVLGGFVKGIVNNMRSVVNTASDVVSHFVSGVSDNLNRVINTGSDLISRFISAIVAAYSRVVSTGASVVNHVVSGINSNLDDLIGRGAAAIGRFVSGVTSNFSDLTTKGASAVTHLVSGITSGVSSNLDNFTGQAKRVAEAIISGLASGIAAGAGSVINALGGVVGRAVSSAKKKLHIKSPSQVFMEIGDQMMQGMAIGIDKSGAQVTSSMEGVVDSVVATISTIPDALDGIVDLNPVIAPVLDLTAVQQSASQLDSLLNVTPITAAASYGQASAIASAGTGPTSTDEAAVPGVPQVKFEQNNYSPEALSEAEIYRQTKNQLSLAKTALSLA